jgi:hypothetical protein
MNAVFFEADHNAVTRQAHRARRKVLAVNAAYPEYKLFGFAAHHVDVRTTHATAKRFGLFSGMAHGKPGHFNGQDDIMLFSTTDKKLTNYTVIGAIVHLYSCHCGKDLGPHLVQIGARAFIGYVDLLAIGSSQSVTDEFVKVAAAIDLSILNGDSHATTKAKADAEFSAVEARLLSNPYTEPREVAKLRRNNHALVGPWTDHKYGRY